MMTSELEHVQELQNCIKDLKETVSRLRQERDDLKAHICDNKTDLYTYENILENKFTPEVVRALIRKFHFKLLFHCFKT